MSRPQVRIPWVPFLLAFLALAVATTVAAQSSIQYVELKPMRTADGATLYQAYCSSCHGPAGLGNGHAARLLQHPVPDLTRLALRDGEFDLRHVEDHILDAHGHVDMPNWQRAFESVNSDHRVILILNNLAREVEAMQQSGVSDRVAQANQVPAPRIVFVRGKAVSNPDGATVYQDYCSACHGVTGQGNGPAARLLQSPPPDLTRIAVRNGGFHRADVVEHIENVAPRDGTLMPCWGQELKSASHDPTMNWLIVSNLAAYLETIQAER